jgi:transposase
VWSFVQAGGEVASGEPSVTGQQRSAASRETWRNSRRRCCNPIAAAPPSSTADGLPNGEDVPARPACATTRITPRIARRRIESSARLGRHRWVIERSLAWLVGYRRLQVRDERRADLLLAFLHLACALTCLKAPNQPKG